MTVKNVFFIDVVEKCAHGIHVLVKLNDSLHGGSCCTFWQAYRRDAITLRMRRKWATQRDRAEIHPACDFSPTARILSPQVARSMTNTATGRRRHAEFTPERAERTRAPVTGRKRHLIAGEEVYAHSKWFSR